jgi:predicted TIM-barrel fold metal-dependent hydrolase
MKPEHLPPRVDTHAHVFHPGLPSLPGGIPTMVRSCSHHDYVAELDRAGIDFGVIAAATFLGTHQEYTLSALTAHQRLRATVIVDPRIDLAGLRDLDRAGVVGVRIGTGNMERPPDLTTPDHQRLFRRIADMNWHVHVYGPRSHLPPALSALDRSGVRIVVDHFGARDNQSGPGSDSFAALQASLAKGRTWVKLSGPYLSEGLNHRELATRFLDAGGDRRLLWGSDWPFVNLGGALDYSRAVSWLAEWIPDEGLRQRIDLNAMELYGFPRSPPGAQ